MSHTESQTIKGKTIIIIIIIIIMHSLWVRSQAREEFIEVNEGTPSPSPLGCDELTS